MSEPSRKPSNYLRPSDGVYIRIAEGLVAEYAYILAAEHIYKECEAREINHTTAWGDCPWRPDNQLWRFRLNPWR